MLLKFSLALPAMLLVSACVIFPRPVVVTPDYDGTIRNADGEAVAGAVVTVHGYGRTATATSAADGAFSVERRRRIVCLHWFVPPGWWYLYEGCRGYMQIDYEQYAASRFYFENEPEEDVVLCRATRLRSDVTLLPTGNSGSAELRSSMEEALKRDLRVGLPRAEIEAYFERHGISYGYDSADAVIHGFARGFSGGIAIRANLHDGVLATLDLHDELWDY